MAYVISVAAVSGGGKTTVTRHLTQHLGHSTALYFDDYTFNGPQDIRVWVENGADYNEWDLSPLIQELEVLQGESWDYIVIDYPFAYAHEQVGRLVDLAVFIDTPLDVAMARRFIRDFRPNGDKELTDVIPEMENYLTRGRQGYLHMLDRIKPMSNLIIDGTLPVDKICEEIADEAARPRDAGTERLRT